MLDRRYSVYPHSLLNRFCWSTRKPGRLRADGAREARLAGPGEDRLLLRLDLDRM